MMLLLYILGGVFVLATLFPGVVNTILVHSRQRHPAEPEMTTFRPEELSSEGADFFDRMTEALAREGFQPVVHAVWEPQATQPRYQMRAINRETREMALAVYARSGTAKNPVSIRYLEFNSVFRNGTQIDTSNYRHLTRMPPFREKKVFLFPQITNPRQLLKLHRRVVSRYAGYEEAILPPRGEELEAMRQEVIRDCQRMARMGYLVHDEMENAYRPTWKGSILMTLRIIWPLSTIRRMLLRRRGNRLINTLLVPGAE